MQCPILYNYGLSWNFFGNFGNGKRNGTILSPPFPYSIQTFSLPILCCSTPSKNRLFCLKCPFFSNFSLLFKRTFVSRGYEWAVIFKRLQFFYRVYCFFPIISGTVVKVG